MGNEFLGLTQTVVKGGCAAKIAATELRKILSKVTFPKLDQNVIVDGSLFDDAGIYKVNSEIALVQTLDFFTPILDTPLLFGQVAAANALSDVYAMGGKPKTAMGILAFPLMSLPTEVIVDVMQGASNTIANSGSAFIGGHSIDDDTLKFGLSCTGFVHPEKIWKNSNAKNGNKLILTKALGTGTLTAALKRREVTEKQINVAIESMSQINNAIDYLDSIQLSAINAATDITGFGLSGHLMQMAIASQVNFKIQFSQLPIFVDALESIKNGFLTKAHKSNDDYTSKNIFSENLNPWEKLLIHDPQTSGGLLLSVNEDQAQSILDTIIKTFPETRIVGDVFTESEHDLRGRVYFE